ncbi:DUF2793 domain-containing protein [Sphingobium sp. AN558]|uniref:DUF2793 domain-containing protein n=1 Tax=Sphingobium sp. AN558 TaxID=3133442 RepID=UPI0030BEDFFF
MTTDATARLALPLLFAGQAQKEVFHNEALTAIDALLHGVAASADLATPPGSPIVGQCWIVAPGASGAWAGRANSVACWTDGGWRFFAACEGLSVLVADRGHRMSWDGSAWLDERLREEGLYLAGHRVVGEQRAAIAGPAGGATIDENARTTIDAILTALRDHGLIAS